MKKILALSVLLLICGCSSFGVRTSTQIPTITVRDNSHATIYLDGSIPGSGVQSNVPVVIDKVVAEILSRLNNQDAAQQSETQTEEQNQTTIEQ